MKKERTGFTTGSAAAAAAIASYLRLTGAAVPSFIDIKLPGGGSIPIPVGERNGITGVFKDAGDDPDVTNGLFICATVEITDGSGITVDGGTGIGRVTRKGLSVPVGNAAINPTPRRMIIDSLRPFLPSGKGAKVTIHAPDGEKIAAKTFNSRLGITGGISILGTSGIVRPMSSDALVASICCEIDMLAAENTHFIWLVPGKIGETALHKAVPGAAAVQFSNYAEEAFTYLRNKGYDEAGVAGHPGKLAKLAMGAKNTHSTRSVQANDYVRSLFGIKNGINSLEEVCMPEWRGQMDILAGKIALKIAEDYGFRSVKVKLFSMAGAGVGNHE